LKTLKPLNLYGESKHKFDLWADSQGVLDRIVGLKYFNIFGPNEYHKEGMRSLVQKGFAQIQETNKISLFKSILSMSNCKRKTVSESLKKKESVAAS